MRHENTIDIHLEIAAPSATNPPRVVTLVGHEQISQPFHFEVGFVAEELDGTMLIGTAACLVFSSGNQEVRRIYGTISAVEETLDGSDRVSRHLATLVPRVHQLTLVRQQEVFLDQSVMEIVGHKLGQFALREPSAVSLQTLLGKYPKREFVVQYEETDLAFISRLTEHLGVSFVFDHCGGSDKIVFTDHNGGFTPFAGCEAVKMCARDDGQGIHELRLSSKMIPGVYVVMDYNYRAPNTDITCTQQSEIGFAGGEVHWGDHHKSEVDGNELAAIRAQERESEQQSYLGKSDLCQLSAGYRYAVDGHTRLQGEELLMVRVEHRVRESRAGSSDDGAHPSVYENSFVAVPHSRTYRPPRITPKPKITGLVTGVVEPKNEVEIEHEPKIDEHGRYRVKFLFDTAPLGGQKASRPVRKAEPTVGPGYGMHFPLRPGVEVVMAFVNGDPDRPIIVGALHNAKTPAHVNAGNATSNTITTASGIRMRFKDN